ncbi:MAG: glycoside hydrolase family 76 protein [Deltaproteobacteria bacterium]|nr:glycoside hydrolase family 76 protein [Deltaproteobacteria bacterium]
MALNRMQKQIDHTLQTAIDWLITSGIQNCDPHSGHQGGFNAWYKIETDSYPFIYAEITGYLTTLLLFLYRETGNKICLERAKKSGEWLLKKLEEHPVIPCLFPVTQTLYDLKKDWAYAFDNGILINTLVNLYRCTGNKRYLNKAKMLADWMMANLQRNDGGFFFAYNIVTKEKLFDQEEVSWSTTRGSFSGKIAIGLLNLFTETGEKRYKQSAERLLHYCLCYQAPEGNFYSYATQPGTHLHPHTYTLEALFIAGHVLKNKHWTEAALKGLKWNYAAQKPSGEFPRKWFDKKFIYCERNDILAQNIRLGILGRVSGLTGRVFDKKLDRSVARLLTKQCTDPHPRANGGFLFGIGEEGNKTRHVNVWVTAFSIQALSFYQKWQKQKTKFEFDPFLFV